MTKSFFYFTPFFIDALQIPSHGYTTHYDTDVSDLRLYVTSRGAKTFFVRKRINGRDQRIILGSYPDTSIDAAREYAIQKMAALKKKPTTKKKHSINQISLREFVPIYIRKKIRRRPESRAKLVKTINRLWESLFPFNLNDITDEHVLTLHRYLEKHHGPSIANRMLEIMRGLYRYANLNNYADHNPAISVSKFIEVRRQRRLNSSEIQTLVRAIKSEKNSTFRAALLMMIYTGEKKSRVFSMRWSDLDFNQSLWETSAGPRALGDLAVVLLEKLPQRSAWVFPNKKSSSGHIVDPKRPWKRILKNTNINNVQLDDINKTLKQIFDKAMRSLETQYPTLEDERRIINQTLSKLKIS